MKNIIFDFGNVLMTFNAKEIVPKFTSSQEEQDFLINSVVNSPEWGGLGLIDTGYLSGEEITNIINDRSNNKYKDLVINFMNNFYEYRYIQQEVIEIIKNLKNKGYKVYLLSNTNEKSYEKVIKDIEYLFDGVVLSYKIHMIKPYEGIYKYLIDKYKIIPEESLFIDDREDNIRTANSLGIKGRTVKPDNVEDIKLVLKEYEIGD
ncbi:MAG: HAD family phosphatase [Bacilli bacterium]|nr:HAD family phosphatase [Bacilli bacterium]